MNKVIPVLDQRAAAPPGGAAFAGGRLADTRGRALRDLRISVTDRCNFRCIYCMPREVFDANYQFLPHEPILTFEEIARLARVFVGLGMEKIRLTGGEPLVRTASAPPGRDARRASGRPHPHHQRLAAGEAGARI